MVASPYPRREDLMRGAQITGWGLALPDTVVTNADYEARLDTNDSGSSAEPGSGATPRRTTIRARDTVRPRALERAERRGGEIDLLVLATDDPDQALPAILGVPHELGCRGAASI